MNQSDLDALWNRIAISQARSARLVDAWLPPTESYEDPSEARAGEARASEARATSDGRATAEEEDTPVQDHSDTTGVGYRASSSTLDAYQTTPRRSLAGNNERLRSLLLGTGKGNARGKKPPMDASGDLGRLTLPGGMGRGRGGAGTDEAGLLLGHQHAGPGARAGVRIGIGRGRGRGQRGGGAGSRTEADEEDEDLGRSAIGRAKKG